MQKFSKNSIPNEMRKLGKYLKNLREETGLSIRAVAERCSISPSYLLKIENGCFATLSIHTLLKFSKFYSIPLPALLKEADLVNRDEYDLPNFPQYLRAKYGLSSLAIRDLEIAKEIVEKKYRLERGRRI